MRLLLSSLLAVLTLPLITSADDMFIPHNFEDVAIQFWKWDSFGQLQPHGTGFYYLDSALGGALIVTNRHVFTGHDSLLARFNDADGISHSNTLYLKDSIGGQFWRAHTDTNVDLAMLPAPKGILFRVLEYFRAKPSSELSLGDIAYFIGFPLTVPSQKVYPLMRHGVVAYVFKEEAKIGNRIFPKGTILIDGTSLGGNSGGPVISTPRKGSDKASLIGIVAGHLNTDSEENTDLGIIIPVEAIADIVNR